MEERLEHIIQETHVTGEEVYEVLRKIEPALEGTTRTLAVIACLSIVITLMDPDISQQKLQDCVSGASQWICLFLSDQPEGVEPGKMN